MARIITERISVLIHLEETAEALFRDMEELEVIKGNITRDVLAMETARAKRTSNVKKWLREVDVLSDKVGGFKNSFILRPDQCLGVCSLCSSVWINYQLGTSAVTMLREVRDLKSRSASFSSLVDQPPPEDEASEEVQSLSGDPAVVGAVDTLSIIREHLCNEQVKILGVYGMGGVGKTTLLSKIRDEMSSSGSHFDKVIWVTISREVNVASIQKAICDQLGLPSQGSESERARKVLLILDDMWEKLDLSRIGIPPLGSANQCKIALTTRSEQVCIAMGAQCKVKVNPLNQGDSWELFCRQIGTKVDINNPEIETRARDVVARCGGLPLTLVTVGKAMVGATTPDKWDEATQKLRYSPEEIRGMHNVFSLLKFSYDGLESDILRQCLRSCSLFPEDWSIYIGGLVELWVAEGILYENHDSDDFIPITSAREEGRRVIEKLKQACLLESGFNEKYVKLHDAVRDMLLWLSAGEYSYAGQGLTQLPPVNRWRGATRVSFMFNTIEEVEPNEIPRCPNLLVLIMPYTRTMTIPDSFFTFMPKLRVLNLASSRITELPKSIGLLAELQLLDVSDANITSLPEEIGNLAKLKILNVRGSCRLSKIPLKSILKLSSLQVLNFFDSNYAWDSNNGNDGLSLEDLEDLKRLEDLGLTVGDLHFVQKIGNSPVLSKSLESLWLTWKAMTSAGTSGVCEVTEELIFSSRVLMKLQFLTLGHFHTLTRIAARKGENDEVVLPSLHRLVIRYCPKLKDLNLCIQLSELTYLHLHECPQIEELVADGCKEKEEESNECPPLFPKLITMNLEHLRNLTSISRRPLLWPSLEHLHVSGCPKLKKLPFKNGSAKKIKNIKCIQRWWDGLEWEEDSIRDAFFPHYSTCQCYYCHQHGG